MIDKMDLESAGGRAVVYRLTGADKIETLEVYVTADGSIRKGSNTDVLPRESLYWTLAEAVKVAKIRLAKLHRESEKAVVDWRKQANRAYRLLEALNSPDDKLWDAYQKAFKEEE